LFLHFFFYGWCFNPQPPPHSLPQVVPTLTAAYDCDLISRVLFLRSTLRVLDRLSVRVGRNQERAPHLVSGSKGEDEAYFYLRKVGFTIVARDYRSPRRRGDIDLIGWEKDTLCFIEVKARSRRKFMPAEAAVDEEKKNTLRALARGIRAPVGPRTREAAKASFRRDQRLPRR
jgi:putative endonuclease